VIRFCPCALHVNREGQITERFTRAIDQLGETDDDGNKRLEIRLGGVYALERIARDSEDDHGPIVEVLTAYVRKHAAWLPKPSEANEDPHPEPDVQAVLTVLGRRFRYYGEVGRLDLAETDLRGSHLPGAHLEKAVLREAHLEKAYLPAAHLEGADLGEAIGLTQAQIGLANGNRQTELPDGLDRPACWD
jgi:hypothetical protein